MINSHLLCLWATQAIWRCVRDSDPWPPQWQCGIPPTELTHHSKKKSGHLIRTSGFYFVYITIHYRRPLTIQLSSTNTLSAAALLLLLLNLIMTVYLLLSVIYLSSKTSKLNFLFGRPGRIIPYCTMDTREPQRSTQCLRRCNTSGYVLTST